MENQRLVENQFGLQESQAPKQSLRRYRSLEGLSVSEDSASSGYSTLDDDEGSLLNVRRRPNQCCKCKRGEDSQSSLVNKVLTETDATEVCNDIGRDWQSLGRNLNFSKTTLDNIADAKSNYGHEDKAHDVLIKFIHRHGRDATKGKLAEALFRIGRRDVAEKLIGNEHFASSTPDQIFFLKEEGSFTVPDEDGQPARFSTCRNIDNGRLYLVRELVGKGYEESCKALKQQDTIADSILKALDVNGIVEAGKRENENKKFKEVQEKIVELLKGLQDIAISLEKQERREKRIQVWEQLLENEKLLTEMQGLETGLLQMTSVVSHLEDPFPLQAQMYNFSLGLSATHKDLDERIKMLREMVPRAKKLLGQIETEKFDQVLKWSSRLGKQIKMREKHFQDLAFKNQQRPRRGQNCTSSEPPPRTSRYPVDVPEIRRASTQPGCEHELRTLGEQVAPSPDPMENSEDVMWL